LKIDWIDQYTGNVYRICTDDRQRRRDSVRVKTYDEILLEYEYHAETKCADLNGNTCTQQTIGLLQRRRVRFDHVKYIGKESNSLEDVEAGAVHSAQSVYTEYEDQARDEWKLKYLPALKNVSLSKLVEESGISRRAVIGKLMARARRLGPEGSFQPSYLLSRHCVAGYASTPGEKGPPAGCVYCRGRQARFSLLILSALSDTRGEVEFPILLVFLQLRRRPPRPRLKD